MIIKHLCIISDFFSSMNNYISSSFVLYNVKFRLMIQDKEPYRNFRICILNISVVFYFEHELVHISSTLVVYNVNFRLMIQEKMWYRSLLNRLFTVVSSKYKWFSILSFVRIELQQKRNYCMGPLILLSLCYLFKM